MRNRFVIGAISDHEEGNTFYAATNITGGASQTGGTKDAVVVAHSHGVSETSRGQKIITGLLNFGGGRKF